MRRTIVTSVHVAVFCAAIVTTVLVDRSSDWEPVALVSMLAVLAVVSDILTIETRGLRLSGAFLALVLAMAFLGPGPAVAIGLLTIVVDTVRARPRIEAVVINFTTYAVYPLLGALLIRWAVHHGADPESTSYGLVVLGLYIVTNLINFALTTLGKLAFYGTSPIAMVRNVLVPILPS